MNSIVADVLAMATVLRQRCVDRHSEHWTKTTR